MLAARRFRFPLALAALCALAVFLFLAPTLGVQVQGVPAMEFHGVPSSGIGGMSAAFSAVRPNVNVPGNGAAGTWLLCQLLLSFQLYAHGSIFAHLHRASRTSPSPSPQ